MKYGVMVGADGQRQIVDAKGKPLGKGDSDVPVLHILPKLLVPEIAVGKDRASFGGIACDEVQLKVSSSLAGDVVPDGGIRIRQPFPNRRYFVAGSSLIRVGWMVPLEMDVTEFDLEFEWTVESPGLWPVLHQDMWTIRHVLHVKLQPGRGITYTMDASCWDQKTCAPMHLTPVTRLEKVVAEGEEVQHRQIGNVVDLVYPEDDGLAGYMVEEVVNIQGIPMDALWTIRAFDEEQLHEVVQTAAVLSETDKHRANALIEMPDELFVAAVNLARNTPFERGSAFAQSVKGVPGGCEQHPALKILCEWWMTVRPDGEPFAPGFVMPLVRVRDDGQYWWGHHEIPNSAVEDFNPGGRNMARIGDLVLVEFSATQAVAMFSEQGMTVLLPNGALGSSVGVGQDEYLSGEYDEAWYGLNALAVFPERFPAAWRFLNKKGREYAQARRAAVAVPVALPDDVSQCRECDGKPQVTFDPTEGVKRPYILTCGDHYSSGGDSLEGALILWDNDQSEAYAQWLKEVERENLEAMDQEMSSQEAQGESSTEGATR